MHTAADDGTEQTSEVFCLVTSLLDIEEYPALDLACCYPDRWGCETVIGHHKTDMGEGQPVLRSKDPEGVMQEMWALLAVYQAIFKIIGIAVNAAGIPPARISFPHALAAATDTVAAFPPDQQEHALATFLLKILIPGFFVRGRPDRASPRKTKKAGDFPARKPGEPSVTNVVRRIEFHLLYPLADHLKARPLGSRPSGPPALGRCAGVIEGRAAWRQETAIRPGLARPWRHAGFPVRRAPCGGLWRESAARQIPLAVRGFAPTQMQHEPRVPGEDQLKADGRGSVSFRRDCYPARPKARPETARRTSRPVPATRTGQNRCGGQDQGADEHG